MDWSRPGSAGSDFTVQDSLVHLCLLLAGATGLALAGVLGYLRTLGLSVILGLAGVAAAAWLFHQPSTPGRRSKHPSARCEPRSHLNVVSCIHGFFRPAPTDVSPNRHRRSWLTTSHLHHVSP